MSLVESFTEAYGHAPEGVWHAPGRVNLIGEHTDYNDGFVLPFALSQGVHVAAARRSDGLLVVRSRQASEAGSEAGEVAVKELAPGSVEGWAAYPAGVAWVLREHGIGGASMYFDSDLPVGAGLSSSAALECATALALCDLYGVSSLDRPTLARLAQRAENDFVGAPTGILDQSASLLCTEGHALFLDCRSGLSTQVPLAMSEAGLSLMVIDTQAPHTHAGGDYGNRRAECEEAARLLGVEALRDVMDLPAALDSLPDPMLRRRVQHVVTENHRVEATVGLLRANALTELGGMLTASHLSLRDQFEISWPAADVAVEESLRAGARGGRMVGGGFGGSVIVLTPTDRVDKITTAVTTAYESRAWPLPLFYDANPSPGARRLS